VRDVLPASPVRSLQRHSAAARRGHYQRMSDPVCAEKYESFAISPEMACAENLQSAGSREFIRFTYFHMCACCGLGSAASTSLWRRPANRAACPAVLAGGQRGPAVRTCRREGLGHGRAQALRSIGVDVRPDGLRRSAKRPILRLQDASLGNGRTQDLRFFETE
jgi:hypothetical protein